MHSLTDHEIDQLASEAAQGNQASFERLIPVIRDLANQASRQIRAPQKAAELREIAVTIIYQTIQAYDPARSFRGFCLSRFRYPDPTEIRPQNRKRQSFANVEELASGTGHEVEEEASSDALSQLMAAIAWPAQNRSNWVDYFAVLIFWVRAQMARAKAYQVTDAEFVARFSEAYLTWPVEVGERRFRHHLPNVESTWQAMRLKASTWTCWRVPGMHHILCNYLRSMAAPPWPDPQVSQQWLSRARAEAKLRLKEVCPEQWTDVLEVIFPRMRRASN